MLLSLEVCELGLLQSFKLSFGGFFLQLHQFVLHFKHVESVGSEEILLVFLEHLVQLSV